MKAPTRCVIALSMLLTPNLVHAQGGDELPDLLGMWTCDQTPIMMRGEPTEVRRNITFNNQVGPTYSAVLEWEILTESGIAGDQEGPAFSGSITLVGVIAWDNRTLHGAAVRDGHTHTAELVDENTIRMITVEPGDNGFATRATCTRSG